MDEYITNRLEYYAQILEEHFRDMMDIDFTVENEKFYILSTRVARRTALANLKIVMGMFCEGKMNVEDVIKKIPYKQIEDFLDIENWNLGRRYILEKQTAKYHGCWTGFCILVFGR